MHKRLNIEDRREILGEAYEELQGLDEDLLRLEGMTDRGKKTGASRESLEQKYPALAGRSVGVPAGDHVPGRPMRNVDPEDEIRAATER